MPNARMTKHSEFGNRVRDGVHDFLKLRLHLSVILFPHP